jgi:hypothetical protein
MKNRITFIIVFIAFVTNSIHGFSQSNDLVFKDIVLEQPLPNIFRVGEIYLLKGEVQNASADVPVTADLLLLDSDYQHVTTLVTKNGKFIISICFEHPGLYNLSLKINYKTSGSVMLNAVHPINVKPRPLLPIQNFNTRIEEFTPKLIWQTKNEITQLIIQQDSIEALFTLTNNPIEFDFKDDKISKFHEGVAAFRIRGARSIDGTWFTMASDWSDWQEIQSILVEKIFPHINPSAIFLAPYSGAGNVQSKIMLELQIKTAYYPEAFIARPDGKVDIVRLQAEQKLSEFSIGGEPKRLYPAGVCSLKYFPAKLGIYLIEINDAYGVALINIPFYCGNLLPVLPGKIFGSQSCDQLNFDLHAERIKILDQINLIRQKLGLQSLILDTNLNMLSQYYSDRMAKEKFTGHVAPSDNEVLDLRRKKFRIIAQILENVAQAYSIGETFFNLLRSPAHYAAMIDSTMTRAGIGISIGEGKCFYLAQHFSGESLSQSELDVFLEKLFKKMKSTREKLIRVEAPCYASHLMQISYSAPTIDRIESMVLNEKSNLTWNNEFVEQICFESFTQTYEGFKLDVKYYPHPGPDKE